MSLSGIGVTSWGWPIQIVLEKNRKGSTAPERSARRIEELYAGALGEDAS